MPPVKPPQPPPNPFPLTGRMREVNEAGYADYLRRQREALTLKTQKLQKRSTKRPKG
jgi:hypothetical protein